MSIKKFSFREIIAYSVTYIIYTSLSFIIFAFWGGMINNSSEKVEETRIKQEKSADTICLENHYGENNILYGFINNIFEFVNAFIPSKVTIILFIFFAYLIYFFMSIWIVHIKSKRNDFKVYVTKAIGSIASGVSSLVYFITATLFISFIGLQFVHKCINKIKIQAGSMLLIYIMLSIFIFILDQHIEDNFKNLIYFNRIRGLKANKRWYEFWKKDYY
ncbi:hypothetical protein [Acinetobacter pittii]|uniref:hypothetical protein n=1 Tax=Acinetobacter pittii TaxID=48296 RepID=UPI003B9E1E4E